MHPAYSVIIFTTISGAGYGLLTLAALGMALGLLPVSPSFMIVLLGISMILVTIGLFSSMTHLGHPERAWRAVSQWRSSWLSREGLFALLTYIPTGLLGLSYIFEIGVELRQILGLAAAILAMITVYCTGMIYASLKTIRAWYQPLTTPIYVVLSLLSGALLLLCLLAVGGAQSGLLVKFAIILCALSLLLKLAYWNKIDEAPYDYTVQQALGFPDAVKIRQVEPAHTQANFVMREMGYKVARSNSARLRKLMVVLGFMVPFLCLAGSAFMPIYMVPLMVVLLISHAIGLMVERWLFFAEAEHVVNLYY